MASRRYAFLHHPPHLGNTMFAFLHRSPFMASRMYDFLHHSPHLGNIMFAFLCHSPDLASTIYAFLCHPPHLGNTMYAFRCLLVVICMSAPECKHIQKLLKNSIEMQSLVLPLVQPRAKFWGTNASQIQALEVASHEDQSKVLKLSEWTPPAKVVHPTLFSETSHACLAT